MTADDVALDALDLMQRWISVTRQTLSDVASQEVAHDKRRSKREKAKSRWVIYLGVMLIKAAEGIDALARVKNVRAMIRPSASKQRFTVAAGATARGIFVQHASGRDICGLLESG
jgi:hypothetical protein